MLFPNSNCPNNYKIQGVLINELRCQISLKNYYQYLDLSVEKLQTICKCIIKMYK